MAQMCKLALLLLFFSTLSMSPLGAQQKPASSRANATAQNPEKQSFLGKWTTADGTRYVEFLANNVCVLGDLQVGNWVTSKEKSEVYFSGKNIMCGGNGMYGREADDIISLDHGMGGEPVKYYRKRPAGPANLLSQSRDSQNGATQHPNVAREKPGFYLDISRCHACSYDDWQKEVIGVLVRAGLRAFTGEMESVNHRPTWVSRKAAAEQWYDSVFIGPFSSETAAQNAATQLTTLLGPINQRLGQPTKLDAVAAGRFQFGSFEIDTRDLQSDAQREPQAAATTPSGCSFITPIEAATVLGVGATNKDKCAYASRDGLRTFSIETVSTNILNQTASQIFAEERNLMGSLGGLLRDEPSVGSNAFSCVWFDLEGGRSSAFVVLKGARVLMAIVAEKQAGNRDLTTQFVDRLRPIVKRVVLGL